MPKNVSTKVMLLIFGLASLPTSASVSAAENGARTFRAGAASVDITPTKLPVIVCGSFQERTADKVQDRLMARALVLDDGASKLALVVVDTLMMPRALVDEAKSLAARATGIPVERMLISATHTHSAPSVMACLGSRVDEAYRAGFAESLAKAVQQANERLTPARIGWAVVQDPAHNHCRRWIFRPDRMQTDPFGRQTVRAHMHPGYQSPNHIGPSGPADPDLSMLSVQTTAGRPLAVLANYAMHYFGSTPVSSDVCGHFGDALAGLIGAPTADPPFVGMLSQGTSGDSHWMDYSQPQAALDLQGYTAALAQAARLAYETIDYHRWVSLDMAETTLRLRRRVPDEERLAWARNIVAGLGERLPGSLPEIYACEQLYLHAEPEVELKLQAVRIGELGITAIPNEVYGLTGLKLKLRSPLQPTFNIELANGGEGYIPPPEQHRLGGYTTWPGARPVWRWKPNRGSSPRCSISWKKSPDKAAGPLSIRRGRTRKPCCNPSPRPIGGLTRWRAFKLGTRWGSTTPNSSRAWPSSFRVRRARRFRRRHEATGPFILRAVASAPGSTTWEMRIRSSSGSGTAFRTTARPVTGYLFSRGVGGSVGAPGDHLGIGGTHRGELTGRLFFFNGDARNQLVIGSTPLQLKTWYHVALMRDGQQVRVYLNGQPQPELAGEVEQTTADDSGQLFFGGRSDGFAPLEGRLDEIAVYSRVVAPAEISKRLPGDWGGVRIRPIRPIGPIGPIHPPLAPNNIDRPLPAIYDRAARLFEHPAGATEAWQPILSGQSSVSRRTRLLLIAVSLWAAAPAFAADPPYYVRKRNWQDSLLDSRERLCCSDQAHAGPPDTVDFVSPVVRGGEAAQRIEVSVSGLQELYLLVEGVPDVTYGAATWADPLLIDENGKTTRLCHLPSLTVVEGEHDIDRNLKSGVSGPLRIAGQPFEHGLHVYANSKVHFRLQGRYERLVAWIGIDDWVGPHGRRAISRGGSSGGGSPGVVGIGGARLRHGTGSARDAVGTGGPDSGSGLDAGRIPRAGWALRQLRRGVSRPWRSKPRNGPPRPAIRNVFGEVRKLYYRSRALDEAYARARAWTSGLCAEPSTICRQASRIATRAGRVLSAVG